MAARFGTTVAEGERWKKRLDGVRRIAHEIDRLTWQEGKVTGEENHRWLVACSDFDGDPDGYARRASAFLAEATARPARSDFVPIAFVGVPPIVSGLHGCFEEAGARAVLNEVQRQFAMPGATGSLVEQYLAYTYPYSFFERLSDIKRRRRGGGCGDRPLRPVVLLPADRGHFIEGGGPGAGPNAGGRRSRPGGRPDEDPGPGVRGDAAGGLSAPSYQFPVFRYSWIPAAAFGRLPSRG